MGVDLVLALHNRNLCGRDLVVPLAYSRPSFFDDFSLCGFGGVFSIRRRTSSGSGGHRKRPIRPLDWRIRLLRSESAAASDSMFGQLSRFRAVFCWRSNDGHLFLKGGVAGGLQVQGFC